MIITCPNCNKQFEIDNSLITNEGRDLQCGSCNHVWFYKSKEYNNELFKLNEEIVSKEIEIKDENKKESIEEKKRSLKNTNTEIKKEKIPEKQKNKTSLKKTENKGSKFFSYLIVLIISFVALIILLDTLKNPLINVFPGLEIILFNLFETLKDLKLFIIDLF